MYAYQTLSCSIGDWTLYTLDRDSNTDSFGAFYSKISCFFGGGIPGHSAGDKPKCMQALTLDSKAFPTEPSPASFLQFIWRQWSEFAKLALDLFAALNVQISYLSLPSA